MTQKEMTQQFIAHEDSSVPALRNVSAVLCRSITTRRDTIRLLRNKATTVDAIYKGCAASTRYANITGAVGGGLGVVAGAITMASGGLATPFVIIGLTCAGGVCSAGGGAWTVKNEYDRSKKIEDLQNELLQQFKKDEEDVTEVQNIIERIKRGDFGEPAKIFRELHFFLAGIGAVGMSFGSSAALELLAFALPPISYCLAGKTSTVLFGMAEYLPRIAGNATIQGMEEVAEQTASLAVKPMYDGFSKDLVKREATIAAHKMYMEALEESCEQLAAKKAAEKAAQKATEEGAKAAAKMTGMVTVGFGAFTLLWEGYNAYSNHRASQKESQFGRELRDLAQTLETVLTRNIPDPA